MKSEAFVEYENTSDSCILSKLQTSVYYTVGLYPGNEHNI